MSRVMVFRHDNSDLEFRLEPLNVPDSVNSENVQTWLLSFSHDGDVYTVIEVLNHVNYKIRERQPLPQYYIEEMPEFSIFNHELNGRG